MTSQVLETYKNDKLYELTFILRDSNDAPYDLTGATLFFRAQRVGTSVLKASGTMNIVNPPTAGTCTYTVQAGDFDVAGDYYAEIEIQFAGGKVLTLGDIIVKVKHELPR